MFSPLTVRQPCVQLNVFQINDNFYSKNGVFIVSHEKGEQRIMIVTWGNQLSYKVQKNHVEGWCSGWQHLQTRMFVGDFQQKLNNRWWRSWAESMNAWSANVLHTALDSYHDSKVLHFSTERIFTEKIFSHRDIWIDDKSYFLIYDSLKKRGSKQRIIISALDKYLFRWHNKLLKFA